MFDCFIEKIGHTDKEPPIIKFEVNDSSLIYHYFNYNLGL